MKAKYPDMARNIKILAEHWKVPETEVLRIAMRRLCLDEDIQEILEDAKEVNHAPGLKTPTVRGEQ